MENKEPSELKNILVQKYACYQASLVYHLKGLFENGPDEIDIYREIWRFKESSAEWGEILQIEEGFSQAIRNSFLAVSGPCQIDGDTNL